MGHISRVMAGLVDEHAALTEFITASPWAMRQGDPAMCDFVAGNPQEMPLPEFTDALLRWTPPQDKDWYAYKEDLPSARKSAAAALSARQGIAFDPDDLLLTPGTFGALSVTLRAILDPGDEVIYVSPPWFFYVGMIKVNGGVPVRIPSPPPDFPLDVDAIASAITERTAAVIINSPNNPTGRIYQPSELQALGDVLRAARERLGRSILLLSDESYARILFDGRAFHPPASSYDDTIVLYTYGKTLLTPGERIGFIALAPTMSERAELRNALLMSAVIGGWQFPNNILRFALPDLEDLTVDIDALQKRRDRVVGALRDFGYELHVPEATFYLLPKSPIADDWAFTRQLVEDDVFVLPGAVFDLPGYFRISITASDDMVDRALPGFARAIERARG